MIFVQKPLNKDIAEIESSNSRSALINQQQRCSRILLMNIIEFIKKHKIPQREIASIIGMSYYMFRKKVSSTQVTFTIEELKEVQEAVPQYIDNLRELFHKNVNKVK